MSVEQPKVILLLMIEIKGDFDDIKEVNLT